MNTPVLAIVCCAVSMECYRRELNHLGHMNALAALFNLWIAL